MIKINSLLCIGVSWDSCQSALRYNKKKIGDITMNDENLLLHIKNCIFYFYFLKIIDVVYLILFSFCTIPNIYVIRYIHVIMEHQCLSILLLDILSVLKPLLAGYSFGSWLNSHIRIFTAASVPPTGCTPKNIKSCSDMSAVLEENSKFVYLFFNLVYNKKYNTEYAN